MNDWNAGYVTEIEYTYGYYPDLNPARARLALLDAGYAAPETLAACELGYGQGLSVNFHAAGSDVEWHGTDFNPAQASFARELAAASGSSAELYDDAFEEYANRTGLPDFDFIGLHGIWTWVSEDNRNVIANFIRKKLRPGGVLYVSYNTLPGWAAYSPMRHLMKEHAKVMGAGGRGIADLGLEAIDFAEKLLATNPLYSAANPQVRERVEALRGQNRHYLAHEFFNSEWRPVQFFEIAKKLQGAKMNFACPANLLDHVDAINLTQQQRSFMNEIPDPVFRESVRDFMVNQNFRKDYWVKGARKLSRHDQIEALKNLRFVLVKNREDVSLRVSGVLGEATMNESVYNPLLDLLADHKPKSICDIEDALKIPFQQIQQAAVVLVGAGHLQPAQSEEDIDKAGKKTERLNAHLCARSKGSGDIGCLVSPVTGEAYKVGRIQQLFLLAISEGKKKPEEWTRHAWEVLDSQGDRILMDGRAIESPEDNLKELNLQARIFAEKLLPILKALRIA